MSDGSTHVLRLLSNSTIGRWVGPTLKMTLQHTQIFSCRKINSNCVHITQREFWDDFCSKFDVRKYDFTFLKFCSRNLSRSCCTIFFCSSILGAVHAICLILLNVKAFSCDPILKKKILLSLGNTQHSTVLTLFLD